jgi:tetratricopeptide (TPR) repeat protein
MRRILIGLALALITLPAWAQTRDENLTGCISHDPDISISGCTALIQSGKETKADLSGFYAERATAYNDKGLYDQAISDFTTAATLTPDSDTFSFTIYSGRGLSYYQKGLYDQAIADYTKAIALQPDNADRYKDRGFAYLQKGLYDQAIADETKAISLKRDDDKSYSGRAYAYEKKGQRDQAIADYRLALKLNPNDDFSKQGLKRLGVTS